MPQQERLRKGVFGSSDDQKLQASLTLVETAAPKEKFFDEALARFSCGRPDVQTVPLLVTRTQDIRASGHLSGRRQPGPEVGIPKLQQGVV